MKILHTETLKHWGGQQNRILQESLGLTQRGFEVIIACHKGSLLSERAKEAGIKTYEVNMTKGSYLLTIPRLVSIIRREKVDIVCTHSSVDSWAGGIASLLTRRKLIRYKHNLYRVKNDPPTRFIYSLPQIFISVSNAAKDILLQAGHIPSSKIKRIYAGINSDEFDPAKPDKNFRKDLRHSLGIPEDALIIGNTSGFTEVKGQSYLLNAANKLFRMYDNLYLLLIGRIGNKEKVFELVEPEFHDRIILPGLRRDIPLLLGIMDIFVFPSTVEAFGYSLIEAMSMSKPVLVSDIPSFREFLSDKTNAIFFRSADSENLLNALISLIQNPGKWQALGDNARKTVMERFQPDRMFNEIEDTCLDLIKRGS